MTKKPLIYKLNFKKNRYTTKEADFQFIVVEDWMNLMNTFSFFCTFDLFLLQARSTITAMILNI